MWALITLSVSILRSAGGLFRNRQEQAVLLEAFPGGLALVPGAQSEHEHR
jgi:hypothetical protein